MIPDSNEIRRSVEASWQLMYGRVQALQNFDLSAESFWRSFSVIFLLLPFYAISIVAEQRLMNDPALLTAGEPVVEHASDLLFLASQLLVLAVDWIAYPIVVGLLAGSLGLRSTYGTFIIVRNWSTLVTIIPMTFANLIYLSGLLSPDLFVFISLPIVGWMLWYRFQITRFAANCSISLAIGLVVLDFILSIFINTGLEGLLGV